MCNYIIAVFMVVCISTEVTAQQAFDMSNFKDYYPISKRTYFSAGLGNNEYETILLDAEPVVYYSIYNNIYSALNKKENRPGHAVYISFQPKLRIYNENSKPIKTPSYKALVGWQPIIRTSPTNFFTLAIETGHYSNGQSQSAFNAIVADGSEESMELYETITDDTDLAAILNRRSGNFSTNFTRLSVNFRFNNAKTTTETLKIHSVTATYQVYHDKFMGVFNFGGYNPKDIELYSRHRIEAKYDYTSYYKEIRYTFEQQTYVHFGIHPSTTPFRSETRAIVYPWDTNLGFFAQFTAGFDDYNYRFVDHFPRVSFGLTWDWFTPFVVTPGSTDGL